MIKIENTEVVGWEAAIRGMRNPKNSWDRMDSDYRYTCFNDRNVCRGGDYRIGPNDHKLMMNLAAGGPVHAKYRRMIAVYVDITAPLYWWKEFDTYKVATVANSCSTMHKIHDKEFTLEDFSCEHLTDDNLESLSDVIERLNYWRDVYNEGSFRSPYSLEDDSLEPKSKKAWWQMIQLLPSSYNQKRTVMLNYEVLAGMYRDRKNHKLDEWVEFAKWITTLPYSEIITGEVK